MKKFSAMFFIFIFSFALGKEIRVIETYPETKPEWMLKGGLFTGKEDGVKYIYFISFGSSSYKDSAREISFMNGGSFMISYIQKIIEKELMKIAEEEKVENLSYGISTKNVDISGIKKMGTYIEKVEVADESKPVKILYFVYLLNRVSYERFVEISEMVKEKTSYSMSQMKLDKKKIKRIEKKIDAWKSKGFEFLHDPEILKDER